MRTAQSPTFGFSSVSLCVISFAAGIIFSVILESQNVIRITKPRRIRNTISDNSSAPIDSPPSPQSVGPIDQPRGLTIYQEAYQNPWQFSTQRTGIDDLHDAYQRIIERDGNLPRVVVSFTSLPKRFAKHARTMVSIIKGQSYLPDQIYINVPRTSRRSEHSFNIPQWIRNDSLISVIRPKIDLGPGTKLIPTIEAELKLGNTHTRIVTVDDDNEGHWTSDSLLQLFAYSLYFEDAALGFTGWNATCMVEDAHCSPQDSGVPERNFRDRWYNFIRQTDDYACHTLSDWLPQYFANCMGAVRKNFVAYADVLEGFRGALYQPRFFALKDLKTLTNAKLVPKYFFLVDDVWFSGWLGVRNISRLVVNPAIHKEAPVAKALRAYSDKRKINRVMAPLTPKDLASQGTPTEVEGGLHSLGINFVEANHLGAKWFGKKGAWGKDLWDRPPGFVYNSEKRMRKSKGD